jgi:hypothetical protein
MKIININDYAIKKRSLPDDTIYYETGKATIEHEEMKGVKKGYRVICGFTQKGDVVVQFNDKNILIPWEELLELAIDKYLGF